MKKTINNLILEVVSTYDNVVWDWNGTLIDDVDMAVSCINKLLIKYQQKKITAKQYREIFDFPVRRYYEIIGFDLKRHSFEEIRDQYVLEYNTNVAKTSSLFPATEELIQKIKAEKNQFILSAVSQWHLDEITSHFNVTPFFNERFGVSDHYATGKIERGYELIKHAGLTGKTILIGDTIHDYEVAKELGFACLLLADGHQSYERLKKITSNVLVGRRNY